MPVTVADVVAWCATVPASPHRTDSPRWLQYVKGYLVVEKIARFKLAGTFTTMVAKCPPISDADLFAASVALNSLKPAPYTPRPQPRRTTNAVNITEATNNASTTYASHRPELLPTINGGKHAAAANNDGNALSHTGNLRQPIAAPNATPNSANRQAASKRLPNIKCASIPTPTPKANNARRSAALT